MATHSSILAWKVPWTEEPGGLTVHGVAKSQTQLSDFTFTFIFRAHQAANMHLEERIPLKKWGRKSQEDRQTIKIGIRETYGKGLFKERSGKSSREVRKRAEPIFIHIRRLGPQHMSLTVVTAKPSLVNLHWFLRISRDGVKEVQLVKSWHGQSAGWRWDGG